MKELKVHNRCKYIDEMCIISETIQLAAEMTVILKIKTTDAYSHPLLQWKTQNFTAVVSIYFQKNKLDSNKNLMKVSY